MPARTSHCLEAGSSHCRLPFATLHHQNSELIAEVLSYGMSGTWNAEIKLFISTEKQNAPRGDLAYLYLL